jgi:RNA 2',3'-cyclic 3'-phosphodiesterase
MKNRIFIAINFPENIKEKLAFSQEEIEDLFSQSEEDGRGPIRWTKKDNLHITLIFIGSLTDQEIGEVCLKTKEIARKHLSFSVNLNKILYGPPEKIPPRMVWAEGEKPEELSLLKADLEKFLREAGIRFESEKGEFKLHATLGRIRSWQWKKIDPEERPEVEKEISLNFQVKSLEVMESILKPRGPEYTILESVPLSE